MCLDFVNNAQFSKKNSASMDTSMGKWLHTQPHPALDEPQGFS